MATFKSGQFGQIRAVHPGRCRAISRSPGHSRRSPWRHLEAVELSTGMWSWGEGDRITLAVPQIGAVYEPVIERVETMLGNNRSYVGRLIEDDFPYSFVITVGQRNTFANLSTPQGSFELVGDTELAWLMPMANAVSDGRGPHSPSARSCGISMPNR